MPANPPAYNIPFPTEAHSAGLNFYSHKDQEDFNDKYLSVKNDLATLVPGLDASEAQLDEFIYTLQCALVNLEPHCHSTVKSSIEAFVKPDVDVLKTLALSLLREVLPDYERKIDILM